MADDIDIEEHDVLDNPHIKSIFPDITNIKIEVFDCNDDENLDFDNENYEPLHYKSEPEDDDAADGDEMIPNIHQNRIILGSKPCASESSSDDEYTTEEMETAPHQMMVQSDVPAPQLLDTYVVLEDWGVILANNPCYCHSCQILFPTENSLDSHKMSVHSLLVAVGNNKAIKSTSKSSISAMRFESQPEVVDNLCNHCNVAFPDEISLLRHSYSLLPMNFRCCICDETFKNEMAFKLHKMRHSGVECFRCPICSCYFKYPNKFASHLSSRHHMEAPESQERVYTDYNCAFCDAKYRDNKGYNGHVFYRHSDYYNKIVDNIECDKFNCSPCSLTFPSAYSEKIHRAAHHSEITPSDVTNDEKQVEKKINQPISPKKVNAKIDLNRRPIPKASLFKCNKCQLHFLSCTVAVEHSKRCVLKKGEWKCKQCRRSFKFADRLGHVSQHRSTDRFKVITIGADTLNRLLCRCKACKICFDERTLLKYHMNGCTESSSVLCSLCNFRVHEHAITKHKRIHSELGTEQFIVVDYASADELSTEKPLKDGACIKQESRRIKKEKFYFYCPTCKCFMKVNKLPDKHSIGKCKRYLMKRICKLCGLKFSVKGFETHNKEHKKFPHLKLRDLTFRNTQSLKKINPPMPDFKNCKKCNVSFVSCVALKSHVCEVDEARVCGYCGNKFSDFAYKLHVPFHEYSNGQKVEKVSTENIPELIKKYESLKIIWNILYMCESCDVILDDYDQVVEHCQNHFCNKDIYNMTTKRCSICDIKFVNTCFEKHMQFHLAKNVTKSTFKIIRYNHDKLLTDDWLNIFKVLAKEQVEQILNKSKYKHTRSVRMDTSVDGPIDLTLYRCAVCSVNVDCDEIADHTENRLHCTGYVQFKCSQCLLCFSKKKSLNTHVLLHRKHIINEKTFRIVSFNDEKDVYVNNSLQPKANAESLKFIRCQHCGKLINKSKYKKHVEYHNYVAKKKNAKYRKNNIAKFVTRSQFQKLDPSKVYNFYKCKSCSVCVFKNTVSKHLCSSANQKKRCAKCHLWFRSSHLNKHLKYHEKHKLTKSNVNVFLFNNTEKYELVYYQCSDCSVCVPEGGSLRRHVCISDLRKWICDKCGLTFNANHSEYHMELHHERTFTKDDVEIRKFNSQHKFERNQYENDSAKKTNVKSQPLKELLLWKCGQSKATVPRKPANEEGDVNEFVRYAHIKMFKCKQCKLLFLSPQSILKHQSSCSNQSEGATCKSCGLVFHKSMVSLHEALQKCGSLDDRICVITFEDEDREFDNNNCLYRCNKCSIHFTSFRGVLNHIERDHVVVAKLGTCERCNVVMNYQSFLRHQQIHHDEDLTFSDLVIFNVDGLTLKDVLKDTPRHLVGVNVSEAVSEPVGEKQAVKRKTNIEDAPSKHTKLNSTLDEDLPRDVRNYEIYKCDVCKLNFLHKRSLERHMLISRHDERQFSCPECNLVFTKISLTRHLKFHHRLDRLLDKEETTSDQMESYKIGSSNEHSKYEPNSGSDTELDVTGDEEDDGDDDDGDDDSVPPSKKPKLNTSITKKTYPSSAYNRFFDDLYECRICRLNYLNKKSLIRHMRLGRHDKKKCDCPQCGLIFTQYSLTRHLKIHHIQNDSARNSKTPSPQVKIPNAMTNKKAFIAETPTVSKKAEDVVTKSPNKLYKCSNCDVYFTSAEACKDHVHRHVTLDPTEYIACKLCDFQFLCEYLGSHMKAHREKTFSIDDLIVEEYHVNNGDINVDIYSAADRLKSKLVTTTTHFDTEDEKKVDSTV